MSHPHSSASHPADTVAGLVVARILQVRLNHILRRFSPVNSRQQQRSSAFQYRQRRALQQIRESHVHRLFAPSNRQYQTGIGIEFHAKTRRSPITSKPRKHPLKQRTSPWHQQNFITFHSVAYCASFNSCGEPAELPLSWWPSATHSSRRACLRSHHQDCFCTLPNPVHRRPTISPAPPKMIWIAKPSNLPLL